VHAASEDDAEKVEKLLIGACRTQDEAPQSGPVIIERMSYSQ
jgi:hypothetical protein